MIRKIAVDNIKCDGCVDTIVKEVSEIKGVNDVKVNQEKGIVTVNYDKNDEVWNQVKSTLKNIGYPESIKSDADIKDELY